MGEELLKLLADEGGLITLGEVFSKFGVQEAVYLIGFLENTEQVVLADIPIDNNPQGRTVGVVMSWDFFANVVRFMRQEFAIASNIPYC